MAEKRKAPLGAAILKGREILVNGQPLGGQSRSGTATPSGSKTAQAPQADDEEEDEEVSQYESMTKDELIAEAEERGLEVERADGEGSPRKSDYIAALEADDEEDEEED